MTVLSLGITTHREWKGGQTIFDRAIQMALAKQGENAKVILLKNGSDMIPRFEGR